MENWQSDNLKKVQLTLSKGKKKKRDDVDDKDDNDAVITNVSQDRVTVTLCNEELFLSTQHSTHIRQVKMWGGIRTVKMTH